MGIHRRFFAARFGDPSKATTGDSKNEPQTGGGGVTSGREDILCEMFAGETTTNFHMSSIYPSLPDRLRQPGRVFGIVEQNSDYRDLHPKKRNDALLNIHRGDARRRHPF